MKKIIEGVSYDTKKSTLLSHFENGFPMDDIRWSVEELYKTMSGKHFLYGSGGPGSPYSVWDNVYDTYIQGEVIIPMNQCDVITWAEEYLPDEKLKNLLKNMKKEMKQQNINIPANLKTALQKLTIREKNAKRAAAQAKEAAQRTSRTYIYW